MTRGRNGSRRFFAFALLVGIALSGAGVVAVVRHTSSKRGAAVSAGGDEAPTEAPRAAGAWRGGAPGKVKLTLQLPPGSALGAVGYVVQSPANTVAARGTLVVPDPSATSVSQDLVLPSGEGHKVTFIGSITGDGAHRTAYLGQRTFDVVPGETSDVRFASGVSSRGTGTPGAGASTLLGGGASSDQDSCQACQLSSAVPLCDPPNLTATSSDDPRTGEQTGIGWGCSTLATPAARAACVALLHCLSVNDCERSGQNPVMGCYCGKAAAAPCLAGEGVDGACIAAYHAAAAVSPGGPAAGASLAQLSRFIAISASDPTTPIGLADNLRKCAIDTPCDVCGAL